MVFRCINIRQVPWEVLKTAAFGLGFQQVYERGGFWDTGSHMYQIAPGLPPPHPTHPHRPRPPPPPHNPEARRNAHLFTIDVADLFVYWLMLFIGYESYLSCTKESLQQETCLEMRIKPIYQQQWFSCLEGIIL